MLLEFENLRIRNATKKDARQLAIWWNDGKVMAHAGWPNGTGETEEEIAERISKDCDDVHRRLIIELDNVPIGEMNYRNLGDGVAEIGIKICDFSKQNKGIGKIVLSMLIECLFTDLGYQKVILDTNYHNKRAQHVYESLGFKQIRINYDAWKDQLGILQTSIDYELIANDFKNYKK